MMALALMEIGSITRIMDMYGYQMNKISGLTIITATGFIRTMDGHGCLVIIGAGRHSIMGVGYMTMLMAGCGCLVMSGRQPGYHGETAAIVTVGLH